MLDKEEFWRIAHPYLEESLRPWGFEAETQGQFMRKHEGYWDGVEIGLLKGNRDFRTLIGIHVPALYEPAKVMDSWDHRGFEVSDFLPDYPFVSTWELRERLEKRLVPRLEREALPWFGKFHSLDDVARRFYENRVAPDPMRDVASPALNPRDAYGWAMYGWMLRELGRSDEAAGWLRKAYDDIRKPRYVDKYGRNVSPDMRRAVHIPQAEHEHRFEELLRQSLGLPPGDQ